MMKKHENKKVFWELMRASAAHRDESRKGFHELQLSDGQPKVLYILKYNDGCVQNKLAEKCSLKPSTMTVLLDKMERDGYIRKSRTHVSGGKSAKVIHLTDFGRQRADDVFALTESLEEKSFRGFSDEEKETLFELLDRVTNNLKSK